MRISVNLNSLYPNLTIEQFIQRIRPMGYDTLEIWGVAHQEIEELKALLDAYQMTLSCFCTRAFDLTDPNGQKEYLEKLEEAVEDAAFLNCRALLTQVGADTGEARALQHSRIVDTLKKAAPILEKANVTLLVEPLNDVKDHKGYYLTSSAEGFEIIREVGSSHVRLLFDVYHQLMMGERVLDMIRPNMEWIGHFHVAATPNRDECLENNPEYAILFEYLNRMGSRIPVGIELFPKEEARSDAILMKLARYLS